MKFEEQREGLEYRVLGGGDRVRLGRGKSQPVQGLAMASL